MYQKNVFCFSRTKKENCHPLLSRKRSLARIVSSPSYKYNEARVKKDNKKARTAPRTDNRRHTVGMLSKQMNLNKKIQNKNRRETFCTKSSSPKQGVHGDSSSLEKTPWKNKSLNIRYYI